MSPVFFYAGRTRNWVYLFFKGYRPELQYMLRFLYYLLTGLLLKFLRAAEAIIYTKRIRKQSIEKDPIFIIGHMRSGTTLLHNLLSLDNNFGYFSTFQAYAPEFSIIGKRVFHFIIRTFVHKKRVMDNMEVSATLPQEEEFSMFALSPFSFFYHMFFPKKAKDFFSKYVLFSAISEKEKTKWKKTYINLIKKGSYINFGKQMLLKNPVNIGRVDVILEMYPNAKFIHIYRNPYDVYCSTKNLYSRLLPICQLQNIKPQEIEKLIRENYRLQLTKFLEEKKSIPKGNITEIRFEDFEKNPIGELENIYSELNLDGFRAHKEKFQDYWKQIENYQKNKFVLSNSDIKKVNQEWSFAFENFAYHMHNI